MTQRVPPLTSARAPLASRKVGHQTLIFVSRCLLMYAELLESVPISMAEYGESHAGLVDGLHNSSLEGESKLQMVMRDNDVLHGL